MATVPIGRLVLAVTLAGKGRERGPGLVQRLRARWLRRRAPTEPVEADPRSCREPGLARSARNDLIHAIGFDPEPLWEFGEKPLPEAGSDSAPRPS